MDHFFDESYSNSVKNTLHHKDFNRHNNSPENLCYVNYYDHSNYHSSISFSEEAYTLGWKKSNENRIWLKENDPEKYQEYLDGLSERKKNFWNSLSTEKRDELRSNISSGIINFHRTSSDARKEKSHIASIFNFRKGNEKLQELLKDTEFNKSFRQSISNSWTEDMKSRVSTRSKEMHKKLWSNKEWADNRRKNHKNSQKPVIDNEILCKIIDLIKGKTSHEITKSDVVNYLNNDTYYTERLKTLNEHKRVPNWTVNDGFTESMIVTCLKDFGYKNWLDLRTKESIHNHRIVSIEYLPDPIEVGTLTIDAEEIVHNHHTFALSCGIFTKNSNLGELKDLEYFLRKLYKSLSVPYSRMEGGEAKSFSIGRSTEISRDEIKFTKFITRLRTKFSELFYNLLKTQLILKGIINEKDWQKEKQNIWFDFIKDSYFSELKQYEILNERLNTVMMIDPYIGRFYSEKWIMLNVLGFNEREIDAMKLQMDLEKEVKSGEEIVTQIDQGETDNILNPPPPEMDPNGLPPNDQTSPQLPPPPEPKTEKPSSGPKIMPKL
jgi:hypothetical protein